jgi:phosphopantothenoylcysteine decarboxylase/phosphopantothenate--cysteine ligase
MSRILLGVSGGIAAYKALEFVRLATGAGHAVRVIQTPTSQRFVGEASFAALTGAPVLVSEFERDPMRGAYPGQEAPGHDPIGHLALVENADVFLIAPASANTIAKLAAGMADNLLTSAALAASCPLVLAPAMNNRMYENPATVANLELLRERGALVVDPDSGRLASKGEEGVGRLAEPARLLEACEAALGHDQSAHAPASSSANGAGAHPHHAMDGLRVLVSAGGTREAIDSVRFIGNSSSGRMGVALAESARRRGAEVTLVAANVSLATDAEIARRDVVSAAELAAACQREFAACDVLLMAAAVADFAPRAAEHGKIKKGGRDGLAIELAPTVDVLASLAVHRAPGQTLVGFAAEHGPEAVEIAAGKLAAKGLDALVVNDISRADIGFDVAHNEVTILSRSPGRSEPHLTHVPRAGKDEVAEAILDAVLELRTAATLRAAADP